MTPETHPLLDVESVVMIELFIITLFVALFGLPWLFRYDRKIPGPLLAKVSKYYRVWLLMGGQGPLKYSLLHKRYGKIVRTGPNHISICDPTFIPIIYDAEHKFQKSNFYNVFRLFYKGKALDTVFTTVDMPRLKSLKSTLVSNLTGRIDLYESNIQRYTNKFVNLMKSKQGDSANISDWAFYWAFDITSSALFGKSFGYMDQGSDFNGMITSFQDAVRFLVVLGQVPEWCPIIIQNQRLKSLIENFQGVTNPADQLLQIIENEVEEHGKRPHDCGTTFLCRVLSKQSYDHDQDRRIDNVNSIFEAFFAAASELAVTVTSVVYCLLKNRMAYQSLIKELRGLQHKDFGPIGNEYIDAVIKESLRLCTSTCPPMERQVPPGGMEAFGYRLPEKTIIAVPQYVVHRDREVYGNDVEIFRPERWLDADKLQLKLMNRNFLAFGKGNRACAGRKLGMEEVRTFFIKVLQSFDIEYAGGPQLPKQTHYWLLEYSDFKIFFREFQD